MIEKVLNFIERYGLSDKTVVVGFSGGFDSMCLLDIMKKISPEKNIKLVAAHYNHNWRGEVAREEQLHCEEFCRENEIEFYTQTAPDDVKKTETDARELRYTFFESVMKLYNADALFTAHNYDDNAETVLYRVIKGTGVVGLKGIVPKRDNIYRPLLGICREEIEKYCVDNGLKPNVDCSNEDIKYKRNYIRHEVLPMLEKINPEIKKALNNLSKVADSESAIIDEYLESLSGILFNGKQINLKSFLKCSVDVQRRIVFECLRRVDIDYDYGSIENICKFINDASVKGSPAKYSLSKDKFLYVNDSIIDIVENYDKDVNVISIDKQGGQYSFNGADFVIKTCSLPEILKDETVACVDLSKFDDLVLRTRRDGDIISPLGLNGSMKLKKYLIDKKIPEPVRDKLVLLCDENEVLWVAGVGLSDKIKTITSPTHKLSVEYSEGIL